MDLFANQSEGEDSYRERSTSPEIPLQGRTTPTSVVRKRPLPTFYAARRVQSKSRKSAATPSRSSFLQDVELRGSDIDGDYESKPII